MSWFIFDLLSETRISLIFRNGPEQKTAVQQRENPESIGISQSCIPAALARGSCCSGTVFGISPFSFLAELVFSQLADSNRNRTSPHAGQIRRTAEFAAGMIQKPGFCSNVKFYIVLFMREREKVFQVETLTYTGTFDSIVERRFRGMPIHRAEDTGRYDIAKMVEKYGQKLIRSRQEYLPAPSGFSTHITWASLCFEFDENVFVTIIAKGNAAVRSRDGEDEYTITVAATKPQSAASALSSLRKEFLPVSDAQGPAFFILTGGRIQRAPLEDQHFLDPARLALHYGEEFPEWANEFLQNVSEPGISIFRGEPGTGKTSFIRHAMCALAKTHRFYFVPVDNFGLLSSGSLTEFWKSEQRNFSTASKVLVLEDSETLLSERGLEKVSPVAALLNLTDGLMTQFIRLHLVCTLNCKSEDVDPALLRPGRLRFFRNFERIPRDRANRLAEHYGFTLPDRADFTLAEIFASPGFRKNTSGAHKEKGPVGFSS
jgi:hypothetical protein